MALNNNAKSQKVCHVNSINSPKVEEHVLFTRGAVGNPEIFPFLKKEVTLVEFAYWWCLLVNMTFCEMYSNNKQRYLQTLHISSG